MKKTLLYLFTFAFFATSVFANSAKKKMTIAEKVEMIYKEMMKNRSSTVSFRKTTEGNVISEETTWQKYNSDGSIVSTKSLYREKIAKTGKIIHEYILLTSKDALWKIYEKGKIAIQIDIDSNSDKADRKKTPKPKTKPRKPQYKLRNYNYKGIDCYEKTSIRPWSSSVAKIVILISKKDYFVYSIKMYDSNGKLNNSMSSSYDTIKKVDKFEPGFFDIPKTYKIYIANTWDERDDFSEVASAKMKIGFGDTKLKEKYKKKFGTLNWDKILKRAKK